MSSVTVLTPNGRRQVVKVDPNKTVLWILEEVCRLQSKFSYDASSFGLKNHNKLLDLSQQFRFSGLPNNSTLEMIELEKKRIEQDVVICVQLEDGTRVNGNFPSSTTLKEIISTMCPEKSSPEESPVVIYMRSEMFGDALETTLKSLGLSSGGRALLRLLNTDPEKLKVQANISAPLPVKPREEDEQPKPRSNVGQPAPSTLIEDVKRLKEAEKQPETKEVFAEPMEVEVGDEAIESEQENAIEKPTVVEQKHSPPEPEPVINVLDDRGTIIFSLDSIKSSSLELPNSFFDLTVAEVQKLYRDLKQQADAVTNMPLMTTALRKLEENKKILNQLSIYKTCAIRIQMPNRYVIQSKFATVDTVGEVINFLKKFLVNPDLDFHLFVTPPKQILDKNVTLIESNCVPSALLHFGCDSMSDNHLKPELFDKLSSGSGASRILLDANNGQSEETINDGAGPSNHNQKKVTVTNNFMPSKASAASSGLPKWFQPRK